MDKYSALKDYIASLGSVAIAFSGGVDSTFLLRVSHDVLAEKAIAVTISSSLFPKRELTEAKSFCGSLGITHIITHIDELSINGFSDNPPNRCYLCKRELFSRLITIAHQHNISHVIEGSNLDDTSDYRPGLKAIDELGIKSPLRHVGLTKSEIRALSQKLGLQTWDKPSYACLASRFVYGEKITPEKLIMVEHAENLLLELGFRQMRVRIHGQLARIEVMPEDFMKAVNFRERIYSELKNFGFTYIALDLKGYETGSMNLPLRSQNITHAQ